MKIKLIFILGLFSIVSFAQVVEKSIDQTFNAFRADENISFFEVSSEMFKMLAEAENTPQELRDYYKKLDNLKMIEVRRNEQAQKVSMYKSFLLGTNLGSFRKLLVSEGKNENMMFLKGKTKSGLNEFLLVSDETIIYVAGTIDLKSVQEFQRILAVAGAAMKG